MVEISVVALPTKLEVERHVVLPAYGICLGDTQARTGGLHSFVEPGENIILAH